MQEGNISEHSHCSGVVEMDDSLRHFPGYGFGKRLVHIRRAIGKRCKARAFLQQHIFV